ncbi:MAG: aminotransferase class I/II-fold pyridoxal phosphate-dependent enzyme [Beijerinckiaceae bacterium]|nr:aminotransferase class I/II-fold pyridoxal phosphate-dependent enzyme [Beijerinckiaceae bacterium]
MDDTYAPLSGNDLGSLLQRMSVASSAAIAPAPRRLRPEFTKFETHPLYREMQLQRSLAEFALIQNPYYRMHEVRAGATTVIDGRSLVNFASYDYLGLNGHPHVIEAVETAVRTFGMSVSASRITAGERAIHRELEASLAGLYGAEDAIVFVSGHAGAVSTLATLLGPKDLIVYDALSHNCVVVGAKLSGAARRSFPHNDFDALEELLDEERERFERVLIVTEGLFSMDGDMPDLQRLIALKEAHSAVLMVDDAHGLGVLGKCGKGVFEAQGIDPRSVDLWLGTLSKTLVSCGGYVTGSRAVVDLLKFHAPGMVYSVGMSAPAAAAAKAALDVMVAEPSRVARLQKNSLLFHTRAKAAGLDCGASCGAAIVPVYVGETVRALALAERLLARGFNAFPIIPPGVPDGSARLRFFLTANHTTDHIEAAVAVTAEEAANVAGLSAATILSRVKAL